MSRVAATVAALGLALAAMPARAAEPGVANPEPPLGLGFLITGLALSAGGAGNLLSAGIMSTAAYGDIVGTDVQPYVVGGSLVVAAVELGIGIPMALYGDSQRRAHKEWRAGTISLVVVPQAGGGVAGIHATF